MSIISAIKDFFKKPEVGGVLLTCGCVVVGAVYDAIKAKTNTDTNNKKGDDNMNNGGCCGNGAAIVLVLFILLIIILGAWI